MKQRVTANPLQIFHETTIDNLYLQQESSVKGFALEAIKRIALDAKESGHGSGPVDAILKIIKITENQNANNEESMRVRGIQRP